MFINSTGYFIPEKRIFNDYLQREYQIEKARVFYLSSACLSAVNAMEMSNISELGNTDSVSALLVLHKISKSIIKAILFAFPFSEADTRQALV
jgi:3-oxoacyl-[acyl-carrier-protein] synthase III